MLRDPTNLDLAARLLCACLSGFAVGFDRGERGRPAGLRTTMLVSLAACLAMIQANLFLSVQGKSANSFVNIDPMRLPLGILSGMGFIGAGVIVRRGDLLLGVTTSATLWMVTVVGLCFGGGQFALGFAGLVLTVMTLSLLRWMELHVIKREHSGLLLIVSRDRSLSAANLQAELEGEGFAVSSIQLGYLCERGLKRLKLRLAWHGPAKVPRTPQVLERLRAAPDVLKLDWRPDSD